jgi:hypothetical protein
MNTRSPNIVEGGSFPRPWYKERWPWILMSGPFAVVVASLISGWIALSTADGLVEENYYKKGLAVGATIAASEKAQSMGIVASLRLTSQKIDISLKASDASFSQPQAVLVTLSHPTRAGLDQTVQLPLADGRYQGAFRLPSAGHWLVTLEDGSKTWRLLGNVELPAVGETVIGGLRPADIRN